MSCQTDRIIYHNCSETASSYSLNKWNINNSNDKFALRETIDKDGKVKRLDFLFNSNNPKLCYLPSIVAYEYKPNQIIETLFSSPNEPLIANECEMPFKTIYHLKDSLIVSTETFFKIDTINFSSQEVSEIKKYINPIVKYSTNDSRNTEIEFYIFSYAKYNGMYPTNKGYKFLKGNYYYDKKPVNQNVIDGLLPVVRDNQKDYPFETVLKNGYNLLYEILEDSNSRMQRMSLNKGSRSIKIINDTSFGLPFKNLGYLSADFNDSFVFVQSYGSGNPNYFHLLKKENGDLLKEGVFIDADEQEEIILYISTRDRYTEIYKLYDVKNNHEIDISDLDIKECNNYIECISIQEVTNDLISLKLGSNKSERTIRYNR